jgi:hypothetical protein
VEILNADTVKAIRKFRYDQFAPSASAESPVHSAAWRGHRAQPSCGDDVNETGVSGKFGLVVY